ncbi:hypothetical protein CAEBREN_25533 [Caenorhabditis brenneri]|uniref:Uncharacterized protein n=1 Tax=Caenorhabditis brenneri TaxID=135651 RepID=G0MDC9_CAEBE|nr:hypothetical protein CAEBREN_25533 [Caenorhabditis brenneri]
MQKTIFYQIIGFFLFVLTSIEADPDDAQVKFIEDLNQLRRWYANDQNKVNMFELEYSPRLNIIAQDCVDNKPAHGKHKTWRFFEIKNYENGAMELNQTFFESSESEIQSKLDDSLTGNNEYVREIEHLVPLQKEIGCAENPKRSSEMKICCVLGHEGTLKSFSFDREGVSGEKCNEFRGFGELDGLCVLDPPSDQVTNKPRIPQSQMTVAPRTTVETELDRLIAKYKAEEQDGDEYDEDFPTTIVVFSGNSISIGFVFVFLILGFI